jgi:hypothetical protein
LSKRVDATIQRRMAPWVATADENIWKVEVFWERGVSVPDCPGWFSRSESWRLSLARIPSVLVLIDEPAL